MQPRITSRKRAIWDLPSQAGPALLVDCFGYAHLVVELRCIQPSYSLGDIALKAGFMYRFA